MGVSGGGWDGWIFLVDSGIEELVLRLFYCGNACDLYFPEKENIGMMSRKLCIFSRVINISKFWFILACLLLFIAVYHVICYLRGRVGRKILLLTV